MIESPRAFDGERQLAEALAAAPGVPLRGCSAALAAAQRATRGGASICPIVRLDGQ